MDWSNLFSMQKQLDKYIETKQDVTGKDLFEEKYLALLVELGELANETRCFKFWSTKPKSDQDVILAEYVDGIHFILSLGLDKGFNYQTKTLHTPKCTETEQFNLVFEMCVAFKNEPTQTNYEKIVERYLQLGNLLGFDENDIYRAYVKKNEINYERQDGGY
ncbi:dUTP diphosphatase [Virgibacillus ndiopensis]|uniref:dUTP diphosphatase n=1 Tax=Virgibacillus ndiopensis TaxID=2004408 RepID=UPI000C088507|nr:dUTP diphosphatase [Virgibacillus ndiopensis]